MATICLVVYTMIVFGLGVLHGRAIEYNKQCCNQPLEEED